MSEPLNVLVGGECSGRVREAFAKRGHNAWSCDLKDTEIPGQHFKGCIFQCFSWAKSTRIKWDILIAHPDCSFLCNSGVRWLWHPDDKHKPANERRPHPQYPNRHRNQVKGVAFFIDLWEQDIPKICIENPIPQAIVKRCVGNYSQIVQPSDFGEPYRKATCLWLKGLPNLVPTDVIDKDKCIQQCHLESPGPERAANRARTYQGIANVMAAQWSPNLKEES
tara:strand:+ start:2802 stop:3467 length:666 start_codon:yes stop_codon:yes gene_type:complete